LSCRPRSVGTQQRNDTAIGHIQTDAPQDLNDIVINNLDVVYFQQDMVCAVTRHLAKYFISDTKQSIFACV
jgi:hypothetical protein